MKQQIIRSVILTGEKDSIQKMKSSIRLSHIELHILPTVQFEKCVLSKSEQRLLRRLNAYDYLFFSSARAVHFFIDFWNELQVDWKLDKAAPVVAVGPMTARACKEAGLVVVSQPTEFTAEHMVKAFPALRDSKVLFPRSANAPEDTIKSINNAGGDVTELPLYKTVYRTETLTYKEEESLRHAYGVVFLSPSSIKSFVNLIKAEKYQHVFEMSMILCIGPRTARTAHRYHFKNVVTASEHTTQGVVDVLATLS